MMDEAAFVAQCHDHAAWLQTGRALLAVSDLVWPTVQQRLDDMMARIETTMRSASLAPADGGASLPAPAIIDPMVFAGLMDAMAANYGYLLLAGYAVENLLKAVRIKRLTLLRKPITYPTNHRYDHAREELGPLSNRERDLLRRLSLFVKWAGRYPVARHRPTVDEANGRTSMSTDREEIRAFCQRVVEKYESLK